MFALGDQLLPFAIPLIRFVRIILMLEMVAQVNVDVCEGEIFA